MSERKPCTYEIEYRVLCGQPSTGPLHVNEEERMRRGAHVYRHEPHRVAQIDRQQPGLRWAR